MRKISFVFLFIGFCLANAQTFVADVNAGYLLGVVNNQTFLIDTIAAPMLKGTEKYEVYDLTGRLGTVSGSTSENFPPCFETYYLSFDTLFENAIGCAIALSSNHNAFPSALSLLPLDNPMAHDIMKLWLVDSGLVNPEVKISQVIVTDLENDGQNEMLIAATLYSDEFMSSANAGNYSVVLLQKTVNGQSKIIPIIYELYTERTEYIAPMTYNIGCILDIDGDNKYEIVLQWQYYEGAGVIILRLTENGVEYLLGSGCGV